MDNAYIVTLRKSILEISGKQINYGSLCNTLNSLVKKRFIVSQESEPSPRQGGRRKVLYLLTIDGKKALKHNYEIQQAAWDGIKDYLPEIDKS